MRWQIALWALMVCMAVSGCGGADVTIQPPAEEPEEDLEFVREREVPEAVEGDEEDLILASVNVSVGENRTLRLDAVGRMEPDGGEKCGIRQVLVYENGKLRQTILAAESKAAAGPLGEGYTESPSIEAAMTVHDMNFDGSEDIDLYGGLTDNSDPHHYWLWDNQAGRYVYAFTLQGAEAREGVDPATGETVQEVISEYRHGHGIDYTDHYRYQGEPYGTLTLTSRHVQDWKKGSEDFPLEEFYIFPDGQETLLRQEFTDYGDDGFAIREVREMVDGELRPVRLEQLEMIDGELRVVRTAQLQLPEEEEPEEEFIEEEGAPEEQPAA